MGDFVACFPVTMRLEGWHQFSNNPHDPGGKTYNGITQRVWDIWCRDNNIPQSDVRKMSDGNCQQIYRVQYWNAVHGDSLPKGLDLCLWDEGVNAGPVQAIKLLQQALGQKVDGHFGLVTSDALKRVNDMHALILKYNTLRLGVLHRLKTWTYFKKGWSARVATISNKAIKMAGGTV